MTDQQQPGPPRPGPQLFGSRPGPVAPVPADRGGDAPAQQAAADSTPVPVAEPGEAVAPAERSAVEETGEPRVDEALAVLDDLAERPTGDQVAGYEQVHRLLQDVLTTVDDA